MPRPATADSAAVAQSQAIAAAALAEDALLIATHIGSAGRNHHPRPLRPDFHFNLAGGPVCVFCDTVPPSPELLDQRAELEGCGCRVVRVGPDDDVGAVIAGLWGMR